jgi:DnaK suppressor protein
LLGDMGQMQSGALDHNSSSGELSTMPVHMADVGSDNYEQEFVLGLVDTERKILEDIDRALNKIKEGTYGVCEGTGQTISKARLEANPYARYCIEYARKIEKGFVKTEQKFELDIDD